MVVTAKGIMDLYALIVIYFLFLLCFFYILTAAEDAKMCHVSFHKSTQL